MLAKQNNAQKSASTFGKSLASSSGASIFAVTKREQSERCHKREASGYEAASTPSLNILKFHSNLCFNPLRLGYWRGYLVSMAVRTRFQPPVTLCAVDMTVGWVYKYWQYVSI